MFSNWFPVVIPLYCQLSPYISSRLSPKSRVFGAFSAWSFELFYSASRTLDFNNTIVKITPVISSSFLEHVCGLFFRLRFVCIVGNA